MLSRQRFQSTRTVAAVFRKTLKLMFDSPAPADRHDVAGL
jgi:hypothetical protein